MWTYGFEPWLESLPDDWYADDELLRSLLDRYAPAADRSRLTELGPLAAGRLRALAEESARPANAPRLRRLDAYDRRVDEVVLPDSTREALAITEGQLGLGAVRYDPFVHYAAVYLLAQNGEAGVACSLACTDGLVRSLEALGDGEPHRRALDEVLGSSPDRVVHGAQFVTEIQGGSDVPANRTRAVPGREGYRIHGRKWFCSNINADWFLVTARSEERDAPPVGLFLVPAYGGRRGARNGYTIDRLKDKLGTRELATAEVTFDGAVAWPIGPPERGLANLLRYVLTPSRYACVLFAAAALRRAERITTRYAGFREAFGRPIARYPLVARTLDAISTARAEALACALELLRLWLAGEKDADAPEAVDFRILLSLAKPVLTRRATALLHEAMMMLGGNGIEERFSPLPRLYRDAVIMETWEGPHNVLYTQALRDLIRFDVRPRDLIARVGGAGDAVEAVVAGLEDAVALGRAGDERATLRIADTAPALIAALGRTALP